MEPGPLLWSDEFILLCQQKETTSSQLTTFVTHRFIQTFNHQQSRDFGLSANPSPHVWDFLNSEKKIGLKKNGNNKSGLQRWEGCIFTWSIGHKRIFGWTRPAVGPADDRPLSVVPQIFGAAVLASRFISTLAPKRVPVVKYPSWNSSYKRVVSNSFDRLVPLSRNWTDRVTAHLVPLLPTLFIMQPMPRLIGLFNPSKKISTKLTVQFYYFFLKPIFIQFCSAAIKRAIFYDNLTQFKSIELKLNEIPAFKYANRSAINSGNRRPDVRLGREDNWMRCCQINVEKWIINHMQIWLEVHHSSRYLLAFGQSNHYYSAASTRWPWRPHLTTGNAAALLEFSPFQFQFFILTAVDDGSHSTFVYLFRSSGMSTA